MWINRMLPSRHIVCCKCLAPALLALLLQPVAANATGKIYGFVDGDGVEHLSNIPNDKRFRVVFIDRLVTAKTALQAPRGVHLLPASKRPYHGSVLRASQHTGIDSALLHAVISVESGYNPAAVSPKGATGLMQLLPATGRRYGGDNLFNPEDNIRAGAEYLKYLLKLFDNNLELALAGYNAGENAVIRYGRRLPPYAETERYVPLVVAHYKRLSQIH